jgi:antitoxin component HigA of HigAB toxin-antitoxin module
MIKHHRASTKDIYLELVEEFAPRRLRTVAQHADAVKMFSKTSLIHQDTRDQAVVDYLDILATLIDQYEQAARLKVDTSKATPAGVVRHLMNSNGLSVSALAKEIGVGQSNLSEMLSGQRQFSKNAIARLCERFVISPELFF